MTLPSIGSVEILQTTTTGFNYPQNAQRVTILSNGTSTGNEVLQSSGLGARSCVLSFRLDDPSDVETLRGLFASKAEATYVDEVGTVWFVRVFEFEPSYTGNELWDCSATLLETASEGS